MEFSCRPVSKPGPLPVHQSSPSPNPVEMPEIKEPTEAIRFHLCVASKAHGVHWQTLAVGQPLHSLPHDSFSTELETLYSRSARMAPSASVAWTMIRSFWPLMKPSSTALRIHARMPSKKPSTL